LSGLADLRSKIYNFLASLAFSSAILFLTNWCIMSLELYWKSVNFFLLTAVNGVNGGKVRLLTGVSASTDSPGNEIFS
jgi:hypothetical protein